MQIPAHLMSWATSMLTPGVAIIVDVETTDLDGAIIEIAAIDASTGATLIDTLVDPCGIAVAPDAERIHGISSADLRGAPTWADIFPIVSALADDRVVLAYNASFDRGRILEDCTRYDLSPAWLADCGRWECIMARRSQALGITENLRLGGGHRALGDVHAAREVLQDIATGN
ncbi:MAG: 3'-5' exonuclease [Rhodococcus sp. (in: high G+C Gram-positive bacteria)]